MHENYFKYSPSVWIVPTLLILLMWSVFYIDDSFNLHLTQLGIYPRTFSGLVGVVCSPFLHGNLNHLANNTISLFIFTAALIYFYREVSLKVLFYGVLLSGIITWLIGRESYHIGASGLIYVIFSFIFFKGLMSQYYRLVALSLTIISVYGGMFWYVFPDIENSISWEGHLAGLITGFVFAVRFKTPDYKKATQYEWEKPDYKPEGDKFLERFDENGNFVNKPIEEEIEEIEEANTSNSEVKIIYTFKEKESE